MRSDEASLRLLVSGELVRVIGPRRPELATFVVDDSIPRGEVLCATSPGSHHPKSCASARSSSIFHPDHWVEPLNAPPSGCFSCLARDPSPGGRRSPFTPARNRDRMPLA